MYWWLCGAYGTQRARAFLLDASSRMASRRFISIADTWQSLHRHLRNPRLRRRSSGPRFRCCLLTLTTHGQPSTQIFLPRELTRSSSTLRSSMLGGGGVRRLGRLALPPTCTTLRRRRSAPSMGTARYVRCPSIECALPSPARSRSSPSWPREWGTRLHGQLCRACFLCSSTARNST